MSIPTLELFSPLSFGERCWPPLGWRHGAIPKNGELSRLACWLFALQRGLRHEPYLIVAADDQPSLLGFLPLCLVRSTLFGKYLVSLPYLNSGGVVAKDGAVAARLIDRAVELADELKVRHFELRHEVELQHPMLRQTFANKALMRLTLPESTDRLWKQLDAKVRNQVRKAEKNLLTVHWGSEDRLPEFYDVFARNMRDLGTPVYGRRLFSSILGQFAEDAELCVVRLDGLPVAAALLIHDGTTTSVPSASSLRRFNSTNANMLMYWHLLCRALERGSRVFDFGRSTLDGNTFRFKKQWGAEPHPSVWQYYVRQGSIADCRPDNPKYRRAIALWQRLPVSLTRLIGPSIVRGIP